MTDDLCELLCLDLPLAEQLRRERPTDAYAAALSGAASALGDATRLSLAVALQRAGELCVCDLSWIAERSESLVSHHLRILRSAGLASSRREGKMVMYTLTREGETLLWALMAVPDKAPA